MKPWIVGGLWGDWGGIVVNCLGKSPEAHGLDLIGFDWI
jgi:hypothetical protein